MMVILAFLFQEVFYLRLIFLYMALGIAATRSSQPEEHSSKTLPAGVGVGEGTGVALGEGVNEAAGRGLLVPVLI